MDLACIDFTMKGRRGCHAAVEIFLPSLFVIFDFFLFRFGRVFALLASGRDVCGGLGI